jgi:hypothetical protein
MPEKYPGQDVHALRRLVKDAAVVHVGVVDDGRPLVIPIAATCAEDDAGILLHGSTGSRWLRLIATGVPVSIAVTAVDGLVVARSAFESSMNYRSAVLFGTCAPLAGEQAVAALDSLTDALIPGRVAEVRRPLPKELAATQMLRFSIEDWTYKVSDGWPEDSPDDVATDTWAGVLPLSRCYREAIPAPDLDAAAVLPESVRRLLSD